MKPIRLLIVDDHALFRAGIRSLLRNSDGISFVAEAGDGEEAVRTVASKRPDVVLMDITMPGLNGLEATTRLSREFPEVGVVVLSMHADPEFVARAFRAGARGYVLKHAEKGELELAIRTVARGDTYLANQIAKPVVEEYAHRVADRDDPREQLTLRQREVLQLIAEGHTSKAIASRLGVSIKTIEAHRGRMMQRLAIHDVAGLVRWAIRHRIVTVEP